jgi:thiol-disulfide isomerase/thioredoxin
MKNSILAIVAMIAFTSCSNAQKKVFSETALKQELATAGGGQATFADILKKHSGKATVIEVWASWCSDCVKAMPKLKELQAAHPEADYVFISMDKTADKWKEGIEKHALSGDHYMAPDGMKGSFGRSIDLDWIPRYIILDKDGKIVTYRAIETDFKLMDQNLNKLK